MNVATLIAELITREGGWNDSPADNAHKLRRAKGDRWDSYATNHGITQFTLSDYIGRQASIHDVRDLTEAEAAEIYRTRYYLEPGIDRLPEAWQVAVFDWGVNSGPVKAIRELQTLCRGHGYDPGPVDGVIGPRTIAAATKLLTVPVRWYLERRRDAYRAIVAADPSQQAHLNGWMDRIDGLEDALA